MSSSDINDGRSTRAEVLDAIRDIVHRRTGLDLSGEFIVKADADGDVVITLCGARLSEGGDIIPGVREYRVTAQYAVEVQVTVEAASEYEANNEARDLLEGLTLEVEWGEGQVTDTVFDHIAEVEEA